MPELKIGKSLIRANVQTYNATENTIEVVFATETTDVVRYDWRSGTYFKEQLVLDEKNMRLGRLKSGVNFLNAHNSYSLNSILGVSVGYSIGKGEGRATIKLSTREDLKPIVDDIKAGIIRNVSVGYTVYKYEKQVLPDDSDETPTYRATDWEVNEISAVPVPADYESGVRSNRSATDQPETTFSVEVIELEVQGTRAKETPSATNDNLKPNNNNSKTKIMYEERALAVGLPKEATLEQIEAAERLKEKTERAASEAATKLERERTAAIRSAVTKSKLPSDFADAYIADGSAIDTVRAAIIDKLSEGDKGPNTTGAVTQGDDREAQGRMKGLTASLLIRSGNIPANSEEKITDEERTLAREYRGMSLMDIGKDYLERAGVSTRGVDKMKLAAMMLGIDAKQGRAITSHTTDFPVLLEGTNRRILLAAYKATADTWRQIATTGNVGDFREYKRMRPGSLTRLDPVLEGGEFKTKKLVDATAEKVSVGTVGNLINVTRQMIVNDDIGAFTTLSKDLGRAAARNIEEDVYALLQMNSGMGPTMMDGNPLFHTSHKNLMSSGGVPSVAQFDAMRQLARKQTDHEGNDFLDIMMSIWLGPVSLSSGARVVNKSTFDPDAVNKLQRANAVLDMFQTIVDSPRLPDTVWYGFSDPSEEPVIEVSFLDGEQNPHLESQIAFDVDGIQWKIRHDYGVSAIGYRGAVLNPGQ